MPTTGKSLMPNSEKYQRLAAELRALAEAAGAPADREQLLSIAARFEDCGEAADTIDARMRKLRVGFQLTA
jgi:hypothetical protein